MSEKLLEVRKSNIYGKGCFALKHFPARKKIALYAGELVKGNRRIEERLWEQEAVNKVIRMGKNLAIDGSVGGNETAFINHSCDPNAEAIIEDDRIFIYAKKNIQPGTEILYDYQYERYPEHTEEDERFYACLCGSPKCRGTILKATKKRSRRKTK